MFGDLDSVNLSATDISSVAREEPTCLKGCAGPFAEHEFRINRFELIVELESLFLGHLAVRRDNFIDSLGCSTGFEQSQ